MDRRIHAASAKNISCDVMALKIDSIRVTRIGDFSLFFVACERSTEIPYACEVNSLATSKATLFRCYPMAQM